jgi:integrase
MYRWAMGEGLLGPNPVNPVIGTNNPQNGPPRERVLDDAELAAIWRACEDDDYGTIVKILALTGCRREEIGGMNWSEIDWNRHALRLPAARVKNKRTHVLPLADLALDIIKTIPRQLGRDRVFGDREQGNGFGSWGRYKAALDLRLAGRVAPWRLHDLRRSVATGMADLGVLPHVIEAVLNHVSGHKAGVAGIYNRSSYEGEVRAALAVWGGHIKEIIDGGIPESRLLRTRVTG